MSDDTLIFNSVDVDGDRVHAYREVGPGGEYTAINVNSHAAWLSPADVDRLVAALRPYGTPGGPIEHVSLARAPIAVDQDAIAHERHERAEALKHASELLPPSQRMAASIERLARFLVDG